MFYVGVSPLAIPVYVSGYAVGVALAEMRTRIYRASSRSFWVVRVTHLHSKDQVGPLGL